MFAIIRKWVTIHLLRLAIEAFVLTLVLFIGITGHRVGVDTVRDINGIRSLWPRTSGKNWHKIVGFVRGTLVQSTIPRSVEILWHLDYAWFKHGLSRPKTALSLVSVEVKIKEKKVALRISYVANPTVNCREKFKLEPFDWLYFVNHLSF